MKCKYTLHVIHFESVEILRTITITILPTMLNVFTYFL